MSYVEQINQENQQTADYLLYVFKQQPTMTEFDRQYFIDLERSIVGTAAHRTFILEVFNFLASRNRQ